MSCLQIPVGLPTATVNKISCSPPRLPGGSVSYATRLTCALRLASNASVYKLISPVCLLAWKGKPGDTNETLRGRLQNVVDSFNKRPSVEEMLKTQIQKQDYAGGVGGIPPDNNYGFGGSGGDDFSEIFEEFIQVMLATFAFIFLYIFIINLKNVEDSPRSRLQQIMENLGRFPITEKVTELPDNWLEAAIINTPTWWDGPEKNKFILKHHPRPSRLDY